MSIKITGLDNLQRQLEEAQRGLEALKGTLATLKFDPADASSVQRAIRDMEQAVDNKIASYRNNPLVAKLAQKSKEWTDRETFSKIGVAPRKTCAKSSASQCADEAGLTRISRYTSVQP